MQEIINRFSVPFEYRLIFTDEALNPSDDMLAALMTRTAQLLPVKAVVFVDSQLAAARPELSRQITRYFQAYPQKLRLVTLQHVPGGEVCKNGLVAFKQCVDALDLAHLDRHSFVLTFGGGAVLDCAGFAASSVHRGIRQIRFPTTILAQNDAGVGVKNGINYNGQKNFLGAFDPPFAVIDDFSLLSTLPPKAWHDGLAEAVKVALIRDASFFDWLQNNAAALCQRDPAATKQMIRRCAELHLKQITTGGDPFERGSARPLDFGHWAAHKLEQLSGFHLSHGHAVAVGIAIDTLYSTRIGLLPAPDQQRVLSLLQQLQFSLTVGADAGLSAPADLPKLLQGIADFQQHLGGKLALTMLQQIGVGIEIDHVDMPLMQECCAQILLTP